MPDFPFTFTLPFPQYIPTRVDNHIIRKLSAMRGQYLDEQTYDAMLLNNDEIIYEVYEIKRPEVAGEFLMGISIIHPGKVGQEFFMTKGHFHNLIETAEVYLCLNGEGFMVMETPEGEAAVEPLSPGSVLYVPPRWAHRSVCTSRQQDLIFFFAYPANAGHDYGTIEKKGFRKLVMEVNGKIQVIDNPRWEIA
jgi:glucose-6-phosphate isomerase